MSTPITRDIASKVLKVVDKGLVLGVGEPPKPYWLCFKCGWHNYHRGRACTRCGRTTISKT